MRKWLWQTREKKTEGEMGGKREGNPLIFHFPWTLRALTNQEALKNQLIKHEWAIIAIADPFP